jgi:phytanoyl-CoA hydroxylase
MSFQQFKNAYDRDGFVIVRRLLTPAEFAELHGNLERCLREQTPPAGDPFFRDYVRHPKWKGLAEALVGEEANARGPDWFNKPPGANNRTPPHQDNFYFQLKPPNVVTLWMALDAVDGENGCLRYVPGSHREGLRAHGPSQVPIFTHSITDYGPADQAREVEIHLQPGDVVAHHGETTHRADANRSARRSRRAFAMIFVGVSCQQTWRPAK